MAKTQKSYFFYGNRIISIQIGTKRTETYTRVASNIHKDLITPHTGLANRFDLWYFIGPSVSTASFLVCPQILSTFHIDSFDDK